jgi:hypothetical protein
MENQGGRKKMLLTTNKFFLSIHLIFITQLNDRDGTMPKGTFLSEGQNQQGD